MNSEERATDDVEELAWKLLSTLPRARLAAVQRRLNPLLQFDILGDLPIELALQVLSNLPYQSLLTCSLVCKRWQILANDQSLWKRLCRANGWAWRPTPRPQPFDQTLNMSNREWDQSDDEGMGDSDSDSEENMYINTLDDAKAELSMMYAELDSGFASTSMTMSFVAPPAPSAIAPSFSNSSRLSNRSRGKQVRHSAPSMLNSVSPPRKPDYKLLHQTHIRLRNRFLNSSYRLSALQTRGAPASGHTNTIYCLQLYTDPDTGRQLLFTGSRDKTVRQWCLATGLVERVISNVHTSSVLSICVHNGYLASAGSDRQVALWDLRANKLVKTITDHEDSVLCVRFDDHQLVSCSKDRSIRIYSFPDLTLRFILDEHRAAVNAVSISDSYIVSGSGDRSIRLWDAKTGKLLRTFDNHHSRGIASIDFMPPIITSGSSDMHLRVFDISTLQGWSTSPEYDRAMTAASSNVAPFPLDGTAGSAGLSSGFLCQSCGSEKNPRRPGSASGSNVNHHHQHGNLVRTVSLGDDFVVSGSYDLTIKVWDKNTGKLVADLAGGHTGRIFCIDFDCTKIVSCGEDQRICVWDFSHGIDTTFLQLS
ncbi:F-box/WD repeat-containing protein 11 [Coprinopsis cinerea AmutBmut pab1-1]|nr:F-box/WD repeat-containing protein 11 [Coprinopsis cinerea AmutBmut pab1-1]